MVSYPQSCLKKGPGCPFRAKFSACQLGKISRPKSPAKSAGTSIWTMITMIRWPWCGYGSQCRISIVRRAISSHHMSFSSNFQSSNPLVSLIQVSESDDFDCDGGPSWTASHIGWQVWQSNNTKQNRDPTWYDMYPIMVQFPRIYIWIRMVWFNIPTYMIMLCRSTFIDTYLKIYVHVVVFGCLGKRWCQRVTIASAFFPSFGSSR